MGKIIRKVQGLKPALAMLTVQIIFSTTNVVYKLAINDGMSVKNLTAYRLMFGTAFTVPLALILERNNRAKLTWRVLFMSFICGLLGGSLFQNLYLASLSLISATFASASINLVPAVTFILAITCGLEKLKLHKAAGKAKVLGTISGIGGAMMLTFLKGVEINIWPIHINILHKKDTGTHSNSKLLGIFCGLASCFCYSLWLIIQAKMSKEYPSHYSSTALMTLMAAAQATIFDLCAEKDWSQWRLGWSIRLLAAAYSGIMASGLVVVLIAWCVKIKGPLYVSVFNPVMLVLTAIVGFLILDENLYLGSAIGAVLIMIGLYMVLWGKHKEIEKVTPLKITTEIGIVEVVVTPTTVEHDNRSCSSINNNSNYESNIVSEDHDSSSKSVQEEGHNIENNIKETASGDMKNANNTKSEEP